VVWRQGSLIGNDSVNKISHALEIAGQFAPKSCHWHTLRRFGKPISRQRRECPLSHVKSLVPLFG
jgi:hypothetical protein